MTEDTESHEPLNETISLSDPTPGEPPFMRKRKEPAVLRFHKFKEETNPKEFWFSECLLYILIHQFYIFLLKLLCYFHFWFKSL